jgi:predicted dehydrogenase
VAQRQAVKIGVAGGGAFGRNHIRKVQATKGADLVGVFDLSAESRAAVASELGVTTYSELDAFLADVDAVVVAIPASAHMAVAVPALTAGRHCLIEKPLAVTGADAAQLVSLANQNSLILQVGHQERYVFGAMGLLDVKEVPQTLFASREGLPGPRGTDVSVTLDLMVHDLDLARQLFKADPVEVAATHLAGERGRADAIEARLTYANGRSARFIASRVAEMRKRTMSVAYKAGTLEIDFVAKGFKDGAGLGLHADFAERLPDAMGAATADFVAAINGDGKVVTTGADGAAAVALAQAIDLASLK